jgi:hypothetical protein
MVELVRSWNDPPKALEVLEVLDLSIHGGLASEFVVQVLQVEFEAALAREAMTQEQIVAYASWRIP